MSVMTPPELDRKLVHGADSQQALHDLEERLQDARTRQLIQRFGVGISLILSAMAVFILFSAVADYFLELGAGWRIGWLCCVTGITIAGALVGWRRWISCYSLSDAAADAELQLAQFGQRLRTTLDYQQQTPPPAAASAGLLAALHRETYIVSEYAEWNEAINTRPLWYSATAAGLLFCGWICSLAVWPEFRIAGARALLIPVEYTTVTYSPETKTVRRGESVVVTANIAGRPIPSARLKFRRARSAESWKVVDFRATTDDGTPSETTSDSDSKETSLHGELTFTLSDLRHDLEFAVVAGPRELPPGLIRVLQPLTLAKTASRIIPPAYTARQPTVGEGLQLNVLEGSNVEFAFHLNRPAADVTFSRLGPTPTTADKSNNQENLAGESSLPLTITGNRVLATVSDLRQNASFTLAARAADGMVMDPATISIRVQLDRKPQISFIQPDEELVVIPTAEVPMVVDADDDIGLQQVGIMYQIGSGPMRTLIEQNAENSSEPFRLTSMLMLEKLGLQYPAAVTYYAFAEDNYFGKPRRTTTPLRYIDIRPFKMEFKVVSGQSGSCNGCSVTLEELITRQRQNLSLTFPLQSAATVEPAAKKRVQTYQSEILDGANEFATGLALMGTSVPTLEAAVTSMEEAVAALEASQITDAVEAEQTALEALIQSRQNLRKLLKQSNSSSASACRKFDRQQRQKLRLPEKKREDQEQQLAAARSKLSDLAKRERKWSEEVRQASPSNPQSSTPKPSTAPAPTPSAKPAQPSPASATASAQGSPSPSNPVPSGQSQPDQSQPNQSQTGKAEPQSPTSNSDDPRSPAEMAAAQQQFKQELAALQQELQSRNGSKSPAADQQIQQAAKSMQSSLDALQQQKGDSAAELAERSAEQLEQLADHLAAMNARDFGQRLEQAEQLAQRLAGSQQALAEKLGTGKPDKGASSPDQNESPGAGAQRGENAKPADSGSTAAASPGQTPARTGAQASRGTPPENGSEEKASETAAAQLAQHEQALAAQVEMLAEVLDRLKADSTAEGDGVRERLGRIHAEHPPREIAATMRQAAGNLQAARHSPGRQGVIAARDELNAVSKALSVARGEFAQPQLKELLQLEEQLAQLQNQLQRSDAGSNDLARAVEQWQQLESRIQKLAAGDRRLSEALENLRAPAEPKATPAATASPGTATPREGQLAATPFAGGERQLPEGFYPGIRLGNANGLRGVSKVLQSKIQEAILAGALLDADQPVPSAYRELVEKYYRTLSDDLK